MISCRSSNKYFIDEYFVQYPGLYHKELNLNVLPSKFLGQKFLIDSIITKQVLVLNIIDLGCYKCIEKIDQWNEFLKKFKKKDKLGIIFVAIGESTDWVISKIHEKQYIIPVVHDVTANFLRQNDIYDYGYNITYIINVDKRVELFGNPFTNRSIYPYFVDLFK